MMPWPTFYIIACVLVAVIVIDASLSRPGTTVLILVHGDNLIRPDMTLRFRLSPTIGRPLEPVVLIESAEEQSELQITELMKPKVGHVGSCRALLGFS